MAKSLEELAKEIFDECLADEEPVTMDEALEMAKQELGAKAIKNYTQAEIEKKAKKPKERKVDVEKGNILDWLGEGLEDRNITYTKDNEVRLNFIYNSTEYTVTLTKHRKKKG